MESSTQALEVFTETSIDASVGASAEASRSAIYFSTISIEAAHIEDPPTSMEGYYIHRSVNRNVLGSNRRKKLPWKYDLKFPWKS